MRVDKSKWKSWELDSKDESKIRKVTCVQEGSRKKLHGIIVLS